MKKYFAKHKLVASLLVTFAYLLTLNTCSANSTPIPGFSGSGVASIADLSSAVFQPSNPSETIVAVCVKTVERSGNVTEKGVWYFGRNANGYIYVKQNLTASWSEYYGPNRAYGGSLKLKFFQKLVMAAKNN